MTKEIKVSNSLPLKQINMAQTAVEWLWNLSLKKELQATDFEHAKAIEKEQIIDACESHADYPFEHKDFEEYYNETYNNGL